MPPKSPAEKQATRTYSAPASEKALDVLELLSTTNEGLTQLELAKTLGRTVTEVFRVLGTLERRGYILRHDGKYRLSHRLFELAFRHPPVEHLLTEALPVMRALSQDIGQSCHLAVRNGRNALIVGQVNSPMPIGIGVKLGSVFPLLETASGAILLAFDDEMQDAAWLDALSEADKALAAERGFPGRMAIVRRNGIVREPSATIAGVTNISAPVFDFAGEILAALTVLFLTQKEMAVDVSIAEARLREAAEAITRAIGGLPHRSDAAASA